MATREAGREAEARRKTFAPNRKRGPISAAERCLALVQEATECARLAQLEIAGVTHNSFDIMAINSATEHLERALVELLCFGPKGDRPRY
ncbi:MAG TPA: hypothetical protein VKU02_27580 [Gemmataceae bacterium]|nr:hypothetical protein [Gemmataceae bacterium]